MTGRTRPALIGAAIVAVLAGLAVVLFTAGRDTDTDRRHGNDGEYGTLGPQPQDSDPATAAKYGLTGMFSWQPVTDYGPGAAMARPGTQQWLTGYLAAEATGAPATGIRPLPEWAGWRAAADTVTAVVTIDNTGQPKNGECLVTATVKQIVQHTNGTSTPWRVMKITASTVSTDQGWRLANYRVTS